VPPHPHPSPPHQGRLQRCLPIYSVIAWRILNATMLSRTAPEAPCTALLEPVEWQALYCA
jgi:hypothetical protein